MKHAATVGIAILCALSALNACAQDLYPFNDREAVEWCNISIVNRSGQEKLPKVLLIGDSITGRYASEVTAALKGKALVSMLATAKSLADPAALDEIKLVLRQAEFAVIHFNSGIHGGLPGYKEGFAELLKLFKQYAPGSKLVWATSTPCSSAGTTKMVQEKNRIAAELVAPLGIPVDDLYSLVASHTNKLWDGGGVHFTAEGTAIQSRQVAQAILALLRAQP